MFTVFEETRAKGRTEGYIFPKGPGLSQKIWKEKIIRKRRKEGAVYFLTAPL